MPRGFEFLRKEELMLLPVRDRLALGLHGCQRVFRYFTTDYVDASWQGPAMRLVEGYLQDGSYDVSELETIKEGWSAFYETADEGPYRDYGSGWSFAGISLLDDLKFDDGSTIGTVQRIPQAFSGIQMFRQNLSPFDPVVRQKFGDYVDRLADPVHRMMRGLHDAMRQAAGSGSVDLGSFTLDMHLEVLPPGSRLQLTRQAPAAEYAHLQQLGLVV